MRDQLMIILGRTKIVDIYKEIELKLLQITLKFIKKGILPEGLDLRKVVVETARYGGDVSTNIAIIISKQMRI